MPNPVVQWQIVCPDPSRTAAFYKSLFGWTVDAANQLGYRQLRTGEKGPDGGVWPGPKDMDRPFIQLFVEVDDIDAMIDRATSLGAKWVVPKAVLPDGDAMAVFNDHDGLSFAICSRKSKQST